VPPLGLVAPSPPGADKPLDAGVELPLAGVVVRESAPLGEVESGEVELGEVESGEVVFFVQRLS
jgi:hypothetical protein